MTKHEDAAAKADVIARARSTAGMFVAPSGKPEASPERTLFEAGKKSAAELLQAYRTKMDTFSSTPLDPDGKIIRLYKGEWSILSGFPGTGKTTLLRQMVCHLLRAGKNVFVANLEQDPEHYLIELAGTAAGQEMPTESQLQAFLDTYGASLRLWGTIGVADHRQLLATVRDLAAAGCDHAIIDNLMMLDVAGDDIEVQRRFASLLTATAATSGTHVTLVAHPRKPLSADQLPAIWDVAGSSNLGNLAYNVYFVRRGPEAGGVPGVTLMELHVLKQRTRGTLGTIQGCYYYGQRQFHLDARQDEPTRYLPDSCYPASGLTEQIPEHIRNPGAFHVEREVEPGAPPWEL